MDKLLGIVLILDVILSLFLPQDKHILWQMVRVIRLLIGLYFVIV